MPTIGASRLLGSPDPAGMEAEAGDGAVVVRVAEAEDAAVAGDEPIPAAGDGGRDADDRALQRDAAHGTVEGGGAEAEDPAVGADQPVAPRGAAGGRTSAGSRSRRGSWHPARRRR